MTLRIDHLGIAVPSLEEALGFWRDQLGARLLDTETLAEQGARVAFLDTGEGHTELIEPTCDDSPIARFLASGRRGLHHIAYRVDDIDAHLEQLRDAGVPLIHEQAVAGSRGTRVAFLHPRGAGGVLVELVEHSTATRE